jgi:hypothetical protein
MAEWYVPCNREQRAMVIQKLPASASVAERWPDGTLNIDCPSSESEDELVNLCEDMGLDCKLV